MELQQPGHLGRPRPKRPRWRAGQRNTWNGHPKWTGKQDVNHQTMAGRMTFIQNINQTFVAGRIISIFHDLFQKYPRNSKIAGIAALSCHSWAHLRASTISNLTWQEHVWREKGLWSSSFTRDINDWYCDITWVTTDIEWDLIRYSIQYSPSLTQYKLSKMGHQPSWAKSRRTRQMPNTEANTSMTWDAIGSKPSWTPSEKWWTIGLSRNRQEDPEYHWLFCGSPEIPWVWVL